MKDLFKKGETNAQIIVKLASSIEKFDGVSGIEFNLDDNKVNHNYPEYNQRLFIPAGGYEYGAYKYTQSGYKHLIGHKEKIGGYYFTKDPFSNNNMCYNNRFATN
ncbi:hypothetical protein AB9J70_17885 [Elizabethkingia anophelis]|uniref:hypothetical protein n=1 Tax=Elizabethkingia anophelis TaxID=1117645 RepID=UPI0035563FBA